MKKFFVFAVAFIAFTGFTFSGKKNDQKLNSSTTVTKKQDHEFSYFRIHKQGKGNVVLNWGVTSSAGVSGFTIQRSYDGDFYDEINQTSCNSEVKFSWKDEGVFPGYIYYRIGCIMNDGSCHYSDIEDIRIVAH